MSGAAQTNATAGSNPAGDARTPVISGLGGLGLPDMPPMLNGVPDASQLTQMLQNPAISQMMQSMVSNPQYINQVLWRITFSLLSRYCRLLVFILLKICFYVLGYESQPPTARNV